LKEFAKGETTRQCGKSTRTAIQVPKRREKTLIADRFND